MVRLNEMTGTPLSLKVHVITTLGSLTLSESKRTRVGAPAKQMWRRACIAVDTETLCHRARTFAIQNLSDWPFKIFSGKI